MIPISFEHGFTLYIGLWFIMLSFLWGKEIWREYSTKWNSMQELLYLCDTCNHSFTSEQYKNITRCPKCNSICIFRKKDKF